MRAFESFFDILCFMKKVLKKIVKLSGFQAALAFLGFLYIRFVYLTNRWQFVNLERIDGYVSNNKPFIICFWHGRLAMLPCAWRWKMPFQMLLSSHRDGRLIGAVLKYFGIGIISGSTTRGGAEAAFGLVKAVRAGTAIGITPDGPKGPVHKVSPGIVTLAKLVQVDIIPVSYATSRRKTLKTWDRFHFPLPFGRGVFVVGTPILCPNPDEVIDTTWQTKVENALNEATNQADVLLSGPDAIQT